MSQIAHIKVSQKQKIFNSAMTPQKNFFFSLNLKKGCTIMGTTWSYNYIIFLKITKRTLIKIIYVYKRSL